MALRFIDGADHYVTGDLSEKYTFANPNASVQAGQGRRGTAALGLGPSAYVSLTFEAQPRWTVGLAMRYGTFTLAGDPGSICEWHTAGAQQLRVVVTPEGYVGVRSSAAVLGQSVRAMHNNTWYYVEMSVLFHATTGEVTVHVDGVEWLHLTGVNTQPSAGGAPNQVILGSPGAFAVLLVDDIYVCDGQGSGTFTTFLGDCRVDALYPNADGTYTAWTPSTGTAHYGVVDEHPPNNDTDYVSATTGGSRDAYQLEPLPTMPNPEVLAVQALLSVRKEDVDEILIKPLLVSGATTSVASTAHALTASYLYARALWTADPAGGAWTEAAVNSLQVGMERV